MKKKQLKVNTFHFVHEGSKTGHPAQIYWANDDKNLYLLVTIGSSEENDDHFIKLKHPVGKVKKTFVYKKPLLAKSRDINQEELKDMEFHIDDYKIILSIQKKEPRYTKSIKRKDKWIFKIERNKKSP